MLCMCTPNSNSMHLSLFPRFYPGIPMRSAVFPFATCKLVGFPCLLAAFLATDQLYVVVIWHKQLFASFTEEEVSLSRHSNQPFDPPRHNSRNSPSLSRTRDRRISSRNWRLYIRKQARSVTRTKIVLCRAVAMEDQVRLFRPQW